MHKKYMLAIDQSTQGTKAMLLNSEGKLNHRFDLPHKQIVNGPGWLEHDLTEIFSNTIAVVRGVINNSGIDKNEIVAVGISNQRETTAVWDKKTGKPINNAVVWNCSRAKDICNEIETAGHGELVQSRTGIRLSPYFPAAKIAWILKNTEGVADKAMSDDLCCGTIDSWLVYKLTRGRSFKTDYSNASRTQLFDIQELKWDDEICSVFGINKNCLAEVCNSDADYGETDFEGFLDKPIPIRGVIGDSQGALFGQECHETGMIKATYGTGSSIMMNIGDMPVFSKNGLVTSIAWSLGGKVTYVLEGNINHSGAVITWLKDDLKLINSAQETYELALSANPTDKTYIVPAFAGLGAPYWDSEATGIISGITRTTGKAEIARAALECIGFQIADIVEIMREEANAGTGVLRADGGATKNRYLMQFQSNILQIPVQISNVEELSGIGAAYIAGLSLGYYNKEIFSHIIRTVLRPNIPAEEIVKKRAGWKNAISLVHTKKEG